MEPEANRPQRRPARRIARWLALAATTVFLLFCLNGWVLADGETPVTGTTGTAKREVTRRCTVLAWNIAKGSMHRGGLRFDSKAEVESRLDEIAARIRKAGPDVVFLSEVVVECALCDVDMVRMLAEKTGLAHWAFGENYNFGLPLFRIVGGNAILSRVPLTPIANPDLAGHRSFFVTRNNRRVLWCAAKLLGTDVLLGAIHTDSFDLANNLRQTRQILDSCVDRPAVLAGDFNAEPHDASLAAIVATRRFCGAVEGAPTFPADAPKQRIDYVFAPKRWKLVAHRVLPGVPHSDHRPVLSVFEAKE